MGADKAGRASDEDIAPDEGAVSLVLALDNS